MSQPRSWWLPPDSRRGAMVTSRGFNPACTDVTRGGGDVALQQPYAGAAPARFGGGGTILRGHFSKFNHWARIDSNREGQFLERVAPGAFSETIAKNRDTMRCLFQHGKDGLIGDKPLGPILDLREDDTGAAYAVRMLDTAYCRELIPGLQAGLYGASFRFAVTRQRIEKAPRRSPHNPEGWPERTITSARVREFGPVTFGAYPSATAGIQAPELVMVPQQQPRSRNRYAPRKTRRTTATWVIRP